MSQIIVQPALPLAPDCTLQEPAESHDAAPQSLTTCGPVTVSFIIPALNEEKHIGRCLKSIQQQHIPTGVASVEVVVVDNQSTDRTAEISREFGARVIKVPPGHPSRARNAGVAAARGDWIAFVDADCELPRDWLTKCCGHRTQNHHIVAVGGIGAPPAERAGWVERAWHALAHVSIGGEPKRVRWLPTFNMLLSRAAFERAGGFDESLPTCEDCDLGYKLSALGELILDSRTQVAHLGESRSLLELFRREAWRSRGNFRLALRRPLDWANWLSLLVPPCLVAGFLVSIGGSLAALSMDWPQWPWLGLLTAILGIVVMLVLRKSRSANPAAIAQQTAVYATYLAGRTAGLFWSFRRVAR